MPTIRDRRDILANATAFPITGSQYEFLPFDALLNFAIKADATDNVNATIHTGTDLLLQNSRVDNLLVATPIQFPEDYDVEEAVAAQERIGIELEERGGITVTVRTAVRITPL